MAVLKDVVGNFTWEAELSADGASAEEKWSASGDR